MSDGSYSVRWASAAKRSICRLPERAAAACVEFIYGALAKNPARVGHPLRLEFEGKHSARRGDFRIIYEIDDDHREVVVVNIEHRSQVYRSR